MAKFNGQAMNAAKSEAKLFGLNPADSQAEAYLQWRGEFRTEYGHDPSCKQIERAWEMAIQGVLCS